jgi:ArsR family transcriptional regulator, arsenate/arsenite/antimonite-responsive transcriptional repressor
MQEAYRALADPHRRTILRVLRSGERTAGELAGVTGLRPAALTHHLMVLKLADLVRVERRGQYQVYSLNTTVFQDLVSELLSWLADPAAEQDAPGTTTGDRL